MPTMSARSRNIGIFFEPWPWLTVVAGKGLPPYRPANAISYILHRVRDISYV
jgi:hypothetical protein